MTDNIGASNSRFLVIGVWVLTIFLAVAFGAAGLAKISGVPTMVEVFETLGFPPWFRVLVGVGELAGAIGVLIRPVAALAALGLALIMLGAVAAHIAATPLIMAVPALILLLVALITAYLRLGYLAVTLAKIATSNS